jgi:signal transduction histidine kinase
MRQTRWTAARSLAQLMAQEPGSPLNAEHATLVVRELDRVEARVQAMLQFAKPETYRFEPICLADEVQRTMAELATYPSIRDVELDLQVVGEERVMGDAERLRQVLVNLVANGIDALTEPGHRRLGVSLACEEGGLALRVRDSGRGISPEIMPRLFDPFVSSKARGAGLGLAIAKRIVEDHGGCIEVSVLEEAGTELCVRLPILPSRGAAQVPVGLS